MEEIDNNIEGIIDNKLIWCPQAEIFISVASKNLVSDEIILTDEKFYECHQFGTQLADGSIEYSCKNCKFEGLPSPRVEI
jgi:hypothetical protein